MTLTNKRPMLMCFRFCNPPISEYYEPDKFKRSRALKIQLVVIKKNAAQNTLNPGRRPATEPLGNISAASSTQSSPANSRDTRVSVLLEIVSRVPSPKQ